MSDSDQILRLEEELRIAMLQSDTGKLQELLADDLIFVSRTGELVSKKDDIAIHASGRLKISEIQFNERLCREFPAGGVVSVRTHVAGSYDGHTFAGDFRYTRVWLEKNGHWQLIAATAHTD